MLIRLLSASSISEGGGGYGSFMYFVGSKSGQCTTVFRFGWCITGGGGYGSG